jgi:hypothetical protein
VGDRGDPVPFACTAGRIARRRGSRQHPRAHGPGNGRPADSQAEEQQQEEDQAAQLPPVEDGKPGTVKAASAVTRQTKPPAYFTQASLLDAMVNVDL